MNKYHTTISRRDFMKGLGLAGAGLGAAAAAAPVFHDIDEVASSTTTHPYHRWWVKEKDYEDLTTPVDWSIFVPYDRAIRYSRPSELTAQVRAEVTKRITECARDKVPGETMRDRALEAAARGWRSNTSRTNWNGIGEEFKIKGWEGPIYRWEGTPEENLQTCRAALHYYGSPRVGAIEVNEHTKRLFNLNHGVWEDIDVAYRDDDGVYHFPNKCQWILCWLMKQSYAQSKYSLRNNPDDPWYNFRFDEGYAAGSQAYAAVAVVKYQAAWFLQAMGYQALRPSLTANVPLGVFSGLVEQGRAHMSCSPDFGNMIRKIDYMVTDMPLAPTKPIDAGIQPFCRACMICAKACPVDALSKEKDSTWDVWPWNRPGYKGWKLNWQKCGDFGESDCVNCHTCCPFNHVEDAAIHAVVRGIAGTTSIFNGFFAEADKIFGYGKQMDDEKLVGWWERDLNTWKHDTLYGFGGTAW